MNRDFQDVDVNIIREVLSLREHKRLLLSLRQINIYEGRLFLGSVAKLVNHTNLMIANVAKSALSKFKHPTAAALLEVQTIKPVTVDDEDLNKLMSANLRGVRFTIYEQKCIDELGKVLHERYGLDGLSDTVRFAVVYARHVMQGQKAPDIDED